MAEEAAFQSTGDRRLVAAVVSLFLPGAGHFVLGRLRRGCVFPAAIAVAILSIPITNVAGVLALPAVWLAAEIDVWLVRRVERRPAGEVVVQVGVLLGALIAFKFTVQRAYVEAYKIPSGGMIPTMLPGDHIYAEKFSYWFAAPRRGDVIVFRYPRERDKTFVKRVVALGGDDVAVLDGIVHVNGRPFARTNERDCRHFDYEEHRRTWFPKEARCVDESVDGRTYTVTYEPGGERDFPRTRVPEGTLFVLGDNRNNSHDSRFWGTVPVEDVIGRASFIWWSSSGPEGIRWGRIGQDLK